MVFGGLDNFIALFHDPPYRGSAILTVAFSLAVSILAMGLALGLAVFAYREIREKGAYRTLLI